MKLMSLYSMLRTPGFKNYMSPNFLPSMVGGDILLGWEQFCPYCKTHIDIGNTVEWDGDKRLLAATYLCCAAALSSTYWCVNMATL